MCGLDRALLRLWLRRGFIFSLQRHSTRSDSAKRPFGMEIPVGIDQDARRSLSLDRPHCYSRDSLSARRKLAVDSSNYLLPTGECWCWVDRDTATGSFAC